MMISLSMHIIYDIVIYILLFFPSSVATFIIRNSKTLKVPNIRHYQQQRYNRYRSRNTIYDIRQSKVLVVPQLLCYCNENNHEFVVSIPTTTVSSPNVASDLLNSYVLPLSEKGYRMNLSPDVFSDIHSSFNDSTYGEFPLSSLDIILDHVEELIRIEEEINFNNNKERQQQRRLKVIDIGSGCGRLVLYMAMTRNIQFHEIIGIEQMECYYNESIVATKRLLQHFDNNGHNVLSDQQHDVDSIRQTSTTTSIALNCGYASNYLSYIHSADIIICYSTAFSSSYFSEAISGLILSNEWNTILTPSAISETTNPTVQPSTPTSVTDPIPNKKSSLYCITIDKALDPLRGWTLIERINVPNPEVGCDSTVFIQKI